MTPSFRFSGHETFPCRYAWLPKAIGVISESPELLADDKKGMVALGLGKNMVRATKFWVQACGMARTLERGSRFEVTELGQQILGRKGHDRFLEDLRTLWLIHWEFCTHVEEPLFAWDFLLNRWPHPELSKSSALKAFRHESNHLDHARDLSDVTLQQHFDTFLHTYVPTRSRKGEIQEDNLDCPLVELRLLELVGEKRVDGSPKQEALYAFRRDSKPEVCPDLFLYFLEDFWRKRCAHEMTLTFRDVATAPGSPGQVLKLREADVRERLEQVQSDSDGVYTYRESATLQQLSRTKTIGAKVLLNAVYRKGRD
jgi:hypothetical protein